MNATERQPAKAVVCMTTFNRLDCARINQEIIKLNYRVGFPIVHACSSEDYEPYLEDVFVRCERKDLRTGALDLLQQSLRVAVQRYACEYVVHLEGDTWIMDEDVIHRIIDKMDRDERLMICTSVWDEDRLAFKYLKQPRPWQGIHMALARVLRGLGLNYHLNCTDSLATQFFVMRPTAGMIETFDDVRYVKGRDLEQAVYRSFCDRYTDRNILRLREREPIHPFNRYVCEKLALYSQHWPARGSANDTREPTHPRYISPLADGKRETLLKFPSVRQGTYIQKLLNAESVDYYNPGASRT